MQEHKKLQILYIIPRFYPFKGGAEQNFLDIAIRTAKEGHEVTVITTNIQYRSEKLPVIEKYKGIKIIRQWSINKQLYAGLYPMLLPFLLKNHFDIIHASGIGFIWREFCLILKNITSPSTKFINTPHGPFMALNNKQGLKGIIKKIYTKILSIIIPRVYDKIIAINPEQYIWMQADYKISENNIVLIPNGINQDYLESEIIEHELNEKIIITYMNRMEWYKGAQDVIRAINEILIKQKIQITNTNFEFYLMGRAGNFTPQLQKLVKEFNLENYVRFVFAPTDQERDRIFYYESQINILPSKWEGFGITLVEAMAKGNVLITTQGNEGKDMIIEEGRSGYIYDFGDYITLSRILLNLLSNYELRRDIRLHNLNWAKHFTWEAIYPLYLELIKILI